MNSAHVFTLSVTLAATACGGSGDQAGSGPWLPWQTGNSWTYQVTDNTKSGPTVQSKVVTVGAPEALGGTGPSAATVAQKVTSVTPPNGPSVVWQADRDGLNVRYRDQNIDVATGAVSEQNDWSPYRVYFDGSTEHTQRGVTWVVAYDEVKAKAGKAPVPSHQEERWTVLSEDEAVTVPAGTFRALVVQKTSADSVKTYWFVRGIGKVKESGGQIEELVTYQVVPAP